MNLLNLKVKHKVFGNGVVTGISDNLLTIQFASKVSNFVYPDAFETFIVAEDTSVQSEFLSEIENNKRAVRKQRLAEETARKAEKELRVTERNGTPSRRIRNNIEDGFGPDYNVRHLAKQPILTYKQVEEQFGIRIAGFGRGINRTPSTVVLVSSIDKKKAGFVYHDHWTTDGDYIYSGE